MKSVNSFSHIYIEHDAKESLLTQKFLQRFPDAHITYVNSYKAVFQRPQQSWKQQKKSIKPILAVKRDNFLYKGSHVSPSYGNKNFFYNALVLNCLYDCHYCYLQGMFRSGYSVFFVNIDDFLTHTKSALLSLDDMYLALSYDTDLLAYEELFPYVRTWLENTHSWKNLTMEIRTKSAHTKLFKELPAPKNLICAWTVSPQEIIELYETSTASLKGRLNALNTALGNGYRVRVCIDPILSVKNWELLYKKLVQTIFSIPYVSAIEDFSIGAFRTNHDYYKSITSIRNDSEIMDGLAPDTSGLVRYHNELELVDTVIKFILDQNPTAVVHRAFEG